jgi:hypothetical protein
LAPFEDQIAADVAIAPAASSSASRHSASFGSAHLAFLSAA